MRTTPSPAPPALADLGYDPWDPAFIADPYPALARLRDHAPIAYDERTNQWLVSRHADVNALLRDQRLGRSYLHVASHEDWGRTPPPADQAPFWDLLAVQMIDLAAANRDPAAFDRPDEIVLDRSANPYLSFGAGIHYCLGAPLAKVEFDILFRRMLSDLPTLPLVVEPRRKPGFILRGLDALPVRT